MKHCFAIFLAAFLASLLLSTEYASAREICPQENCLTNEKCDDEVVGGKAACLAHGTTCCSVVKNEYRTHCNHHGGICMEKCGVQLQRDVIDCPNSQVCCVLV